MDRRLQKAARLAQEGRHEDAARLYDQTAQSLAGRGQASQALQAWLQAGDAWRRADWLARAESALAQAQALADPSTRPGAALWCVAGCSRMAVALGALNLGAARTLAEGLERHRRGVSDGVQAMVLDGLVEAAFLRGDLDRAQGLLAELAPLATGPVTAALRFREGILARRQGSLGAAMALLGAALAQSSGPRMAGARVGVHLERARCLLAQGASVEAADAVDQAAVDAALVQRQALVWAVAGMRARTDAARGSGAGAAQVDPGVVFARSRALVALEVELRVDRARAWEVLGRSGAAEELAWARGVAARTGAGGLVPS